MKSQICDLLGIEFPMVAFSHCRDVVAAVSKAGGMGVLGAVGLSPEKLEIELNWIDEHVDGKPYGVDVLIPNSYIGKGEDLSTDDLRTMIPQEHRDFRADLLEQHDINASDLRSSDDSKELEQKTNESLGAGLERAQEVLEVAFSHPIGLVANALGVPPKWMLEMGKQNNVPVAALVGAKQHAVKQAEAGVDIIVASGTEGGGHCGSVSSMVLVPEIRRALKAYGNVPILAAGGICTGEQMAGIMAMGADGVWCASVFLPTSDSETSDNIKEKMVAASSSHTIRSKSRTGKHSRQLTSPWVEAWENKDAPEPLPMPLQTMVSEPALKKVADQAAIGHEGAKQLETYWVGQGIGLVNETISAGQTVQKFKEEFIDSYERINGFFSD